MSKQYITQPQMLLGRQYDKVWGPFEVKGKLTYDARKGYRILTITEEFNPRKTYQ